MTRHGNYRRIGHDGAAQAQRPYFDPMDRHHPWGGVHRLQFPDCYPFQLNDPTTSQVLSAVNDLHARTWADLLPAD